MFLLNLGSPDQRDGKLGYQLVSHLPSLAVGQSVDVKCDLNNWAFADMREVNKVSGKGMML